jgi:ABC-type multidrug transport system ATPase subunit
VQRFPEVVKQIKAMGIAVLSAESNLVHAAKVADRLYAIDRGAIIFAGTPQAVFGHVKSSKPSVVNLHGPSVPLPGYSLDQNNQYVIDPMSMLAIPLYAVLAIVVKC